MSLKDSIIYRLKRIKPIWYILVVCILFFTFTTNSFLTMRNIRNLMLQISSSGIMALGMTFLMINGFFDLSVGSVMAFAAAITVLLIPMFGVFFSMVIALVLSSLIGVVNGALVVKAKINAFVVTLGAMIGVRGVVYFLTNERPIISMNPNLLLLANSKLFSLPLIFYVFIGLLIVSKIVMERTNHGRNTYAIGGNSEAADFLGVKNGFHTFLNFVICSTAAGFGGLIGASRMGSVTPILGLGNEVLIITAVVLGGTKLNGGYGSILGTLGGVLVLGIIQNGLNQLAVQIYYQMLINGIILIIVIFFDSKVNPFATQNLEKGGNNLKITK